MPGPSPKPDAIRRNAPRIEWIGLPESGNPHPVPPMPAGFQWSMKSEDLWNRLWHSPQSLMWNTETMPLLERLIGIYDDFYTHGYLAAGLHSIVDKIEDKLGLNPKALIQLRWRIVPDHLATVGPDVPSQPVLAPVTDMPTKKQRRNLDY